MAKAKNITAASVPTVGAEPSEPTVGAKPSEPSFTHRIAAIPATGFCRAGRRWSDEGCDVNQNEFSDAQWAAIEAEPLLTVAPL